MTAIHGYSYAPSAYASQHAAARSAAETNVPLQPSAVPENEEATRRVNGVAEGQVLGPASSRNKQKEISSREPADKQSQEEAIESKIVDEVARKQIESLKQRDREVRAHEAAHLAVAGQYATSGARYTYQRGPDGRNYAVGGSVGIDISAESDPESTIRKADQVKRAALAPAEPSAQDRSVAAAAVSMKQQAQNELLEIKAEERAESVAREEEQRSDNDSAASTLEEGSENSLAGVHGHSSVKSISETDVTHKDQSAAAGDDRAAKADTDGLTGLEETNAICTVCGGSHGSKGHVAANQAKIDGAYGASAASGESTKAGSILSLV